MLQDLAEGFGSDPLLGLLPEVQSLHKAMRAGFAVGGDCLPSAEAVHGCELDLV